MTGEVNFTGAYEEEERLPNGFSISLYRLPCDVAFDEALFGIAIVLFVRAAMHSILFLHKSKQANAFAVYGVEKVRSQREPAGGAFACVHTVGRDSPLPALPPSTHD